MSLFKLKESLVNRIFAISIVPSMIVILVVTAIYYFKTADLVEREIMSKQLPAQLSTVTKTIESEIQPFITQSNMMAISVYTRRWMAKGLPDDGLSTYQESVNQQLKDLNLSSIYLADLVNNQMLLNGQKQGSLQPNGRDLWVNKTKESKNNYSVVSDVQSITNQLAVYINHKVFDAQNKLIAITGAAADMKDLIDLIKKQHLGVTKG